VYQAELVEAKLQDLGTFDNVDMLSADDFLDQEFLKDQMAESGAISRDDQLYEQAQVNMKIIDEFLAGIDFNL